MTDQLPSRTPARGSLTQVEERSPKNGMLTFTLACLGGFWGLHRFYTGRFWTGLLMLFTGGGFIVWWVLDVLILLSGRFKDGEGRVLGPPRKRGRPQLNERRISRPEPQGRLDTRSQTNSDDVPIDDLLEDPLEDEFKQLERELSTDGSP